VYKWVLLAGAILTEVAGTLGLRAFQDHPGWLALVVPGYLASFVFLSAVLRAGMPIGVAYGIWGACGTALTAILAAVIFGEPFTLPVVVGIGLIIAGVLVVELGSQRAESARRAVQEPAR
jgi:small multidrug resistance pump